MVHPIRDHLDIKGTQLIESSKCPGHPLHHLNLLPTGRRRQIHSTPSSYYGALCASVPPPRHAELRGPGYFSTLCPGLWSLPQPIPYSWRSLPLCTSPHVDVPCPVGPTAALEYHISPGFLAAPGVLFGLPEGRRDHPGYPIGHPHSRHLHTRVAPPWGDTLGLPGGSREAGTTTTPGQQLGLPGGPREAKQQQP